jgi:hypothetical protein
MRYWIPVSFIAALIFSQEALSQTTGGSTISSEDKNKNIEQLMKSQSKIYESMTESMTKSLPSMTDALTGMTGVLKKLEGMKEERNKTVTKQTSELNIKTDEVLTLIDKGKKSRAKIKALGIKWTPIGVGHVDAERSAHFDGIREEVLELIK